MLSCRFEITFLGCVVFLATNQRVIVSIHICIEFLLDYSSNKLETCQVLFFIFYIDIYVYILIF